MFKFDLEKYKPKKVNEVNGTKKYFCRIRKIHLNITPEEKVRQAFLNFLIDEIRIPIKNIEVEKHLFFYNKDKNGRIDILINDNEGLALAIYECKSEFEGLTHEVEEQGYKYYETLNDAKYLGFVIGDEVTILSTIENNSVSVLTNQPSLKEMLNNDFEYFTVPEKANFKRYNHKEPFNVEDINELIECGNLGEHTNAKFYSFIFNFISWVLEDDTLHSKNFTDVGTKYTKYGNAAGGSFYNDYRGFILENLPSKPTIWITVTSMATSENNIGTSLLVAIEENGKRHSSLQLRLDNFLVPKDNFFEIWHDGKITVGKLGSVKKQILVDFVKSKKANLVIDNKIYLGKFNCENEIKSNQKETKEFITNLIDYSLLRDQFRVLKKNNLI